MDDKIKRLTEKILAEGVEKGKVQAEELLNEAQSKSKETLFSAQIEAEKIVANARKEADEMIKNTQGELKLAAAQTLQALKSAIADELSQSLSSLASEEISKDQNTLFAVLLKIVGNWSSEEGLRIETEDAKSLETYFNTKAKELLNKGVTIQEVAGRKREFTLKPANGSYKVNFGEQELKELFLSFLRPRLIELLFK